jgi:hypothetical protein
LNGTVAQPFTVEWVVDFTDATADATDLEGLSGSVSFTGEDAERQQAVVLLNVDDIVEGNELFYLHVTVSEGSLVLGPSQSAMGTIIDDSGPFAVLLFVFGCYCRFGGVY